MLDVLKPFDFSILDSLTELKGERETLRQRLAKMNEAGSSVNAAVLQRVRTDYESRLAAVEARAAELKEKGRSLYRDLSPVQAEVRSAFEGCKLDDEEIRLRHDVGEIDGKEQQARLAKLDEARQRSEAGLAEIEAIAARFHGAFDSPAELEAPVAPPVRSAPTEAPAPTPAPDTIPRPSAEVDDDDKTWVTAPEAPPAPAASSPAPPPPPPASSPAPSVAPPVPAATEIFSAAAPGQNPSGGGAAAAAPQAGAADAARGARLEALDADVEPNVFLLEPLTFIGRTPENQVRIFKPAVSRRHAQIASSAGVWTLRDLSSENGSYVNGQRITEKLLVDGDRVQFGTSRFVFKSA